jgi:spore maturation protein CgeB
MKIVFFVHSLISDWNHGNAHFLRGLSRSLQRRGHEVVNCERWVDWSVKHLFKDHGHMPIVDAARTFADLTVAAYGATASLAEELDALTRGADLVVVHEFNPPAVVNEIGRLRARRDDFALLFHDTHHRAVSAPEQMAQFDLRSYDGVLAYGASLAAIYRKKWPNCPVWTFHEAADTSVFFPQTAPIVDDVVWIGNWGDEERSGEIREFLIDTAAALPELRFAVHGVRYPARAARDLRRAGIDFRGWIANHRVPEAFARAKMTVHIPRGPYRHLLPGIPTIRPFEAMACGIPLLSTPWSDSEGLFRANIDYLQVTTPAELRGQVVRLAGSAEARAALRANGLATIRAAHTCDHRAVQLEEIVSEIAAVKSPASSS